MDHILLIGTHWILRHGIKQTLKRLELMIVGEGENIANAWNDKNGGIMPDIVLVMYGHAGQFETALETVSVARERFADAKLAIWGNATSPEEVSAAIRAGADALLSPTLTSRLLGNSLQLVLQGHKLFPTLPIQEVELESEILNEPMSLVLPLSLRNLEPELPDHPLAATSRVIKLEDHICPNRSHEGADISVRGSDGTGPRGVTRSVVPSSREWDILRCLCSGKSNKIIARELNISETTVKVHMKSLLRKLSVSNRTQAAIWARNHGSGTGVDMEPLLISASAHRE